MSMKFVRTWHEVSFDSAFDGDHYAIFTSHTPCKFAHPNCAECLRIAKSIPRRTFWRNVFYTALGLPALFVWLWMNYRMVIHLKHQTAVHPWEAIVFVVSSLIVSVLPGMTKGKKVKP